MKRFFKVAGILVCVFILAGLVLPDDFKIKRRTEILAAPQSIHPFVDNLAMWSLWSPWQAMDPTIQVSIGQPGSGIGANQKWSDRNGGGQLTITNSDPEQGIRYDLYFGNRQEKYDAMVQYHPITETVTEVSWTMTGKMDIPIVGAYLAMAADTMIGDAFEDGLEKLKQVVEEQPTAEATTL